MVFIRVNARGEGWVRQTFSPLGLMASPFVYDEQTVYQAGRVEGVLRMDVPPVRLGYDEACIGASGVDMGEDMLSTAGDEGRNRNQELNHWEER